MLRSLKRAAVNGQFVAIYSTLMPLDIVHVHFDCAGLQNLGAGGRCFQRQRSRCGAVRIFAHGGHFARRARGKPRVLVLQKRLFATARVGGVFFEMQFSWQAQRFGHGGDRRGAQIS